MKACRASTQRTLELVLTHLSKGFKQGQVEPLEEGKGLGATGHLAKCHAGNEGQEISSYALGHLGLVEIEFTFGMEQIPEIRCG